MAIAHEWEEVIEALDRLSVYRKLRPTLIAMRKLVFMIKDDPTFAGVHPRLSHAFLTLSHEQISRRVYVGWRDEKYNIAFYDLPFEISEEKTIVGENDVVRVLREYLESLTARNPDDPGRE